MMKVEPQEMAQALGVAIGRILYNAADQVVERKLHTPEGQAEMAAHLRVSGWTVTPPKATRRTRARRAK